LRRQGSNLLLPVVLSMAIAGGLQAQSVSTVQAYYDNLGRLSKIVDTGGNVTTYTYDADGDIQQVSQSTVTSGVLSVFSVSPLRGPAGTTVTIQGQGFGTGAGSNTVQFNGTAATVVSATSSSLVVTVPAGATSGPISLSAGGTTVQSSSFSVLLVLLSIAIGPGSPSVVAGTSRQLSATGHYSDGSTQNLTNSVTWLSATPGVATISSTGNVSAELVGTANILAILGTAYGQTTVTVVAPTLVSIAVSPSNPSARPGLTVQFTATGTYTDGSTPSITFAVTWSSSNTSVASFSPETADLVNTLAPGTTTITATQGSVSASTTLSVPALTSIAVTPANPTLLFLAQQQFTATGTFANAQTEDFTAAVNWSSSNSAVAAISNSSGSQGLATVGTTNGPATITATLTSATLGTMSGSTTVTVPALSSLAVTPANPTFGTGVNLQFTATGTFANAATADLTAGVTWSSSDTAVASIGNSAGSRGLSTTAKAGTSTIQAALDSISGSTLLTVTQSGSGPTANPRFAFISSTGAYGSVASFAVDSGTGLLAPMGYADVTGISASVTDPSGRYLYFLGSNSGSFGGFTINPDTAALTAIAGSFPPFSTGLDTPVALAVDPTGAYVYATGQRGLYAYTIGAGGALTEISGSPFNTGSRSSVVTASPAGGYIYTANSTADTISAFAITAGTGVLTAVPGSPFTTASLPESIAIDPTGSFLYVANEGSNQVSVYTISPASGALTPIAGSPFAAGEFPIWLQMHPSGKFLFALNAGTNELGNVTAFLIDSSSGALSTVPSSPFAVGTQPLSMTVDPSGNFLYVTNQQRTVYPLACCVNDVSMYTIDTTTGALSALRSFRTRGTAQSVAFTSGSAPVGFAPQFAYVANQTDGTISASGIDASTGALTAVTGSPFPAGTGPVSMAANLAGTLVFAANHGGGNISADTIGSGALTSVTGTPFPAGTSPASVAVDPSSRFLYAANQGSANVSAYSIAASGVLTAISGSPFALPLGSESGPVSIAVDPEGVFLYIADGGSSDIANFTVAAGTGSLSNGNTTIAYLGTIPSSPAAVTVDPTGNFVYVADSGAGEVSAYSIEDAIGGTLSPVAGSPVMAGSKPSAVAVDRLSRFLYVANSGSNNVSAYTINPTTGALTAVTGSPFEAGTKPSSVAVDFSATFLYVTNSGDNNVSIFNINQTTGALSPVSAPAAPTGNSPQSITTTGAIH